MKPLELIIGFVSVITVVAVLTFCFFALSHWLSLPPREITIHIIQEPAK